ncbi:MAG: isochorismate synthase [Bacteroidia bacterium]|nr:isochorismate synthase [Bacteroidia bacterium]
MKTDNFIYWKNAGNTDVYCIKTPFLKKISIDEIYNEGFAFFPFDKSSQGLIFEGKIIKSDFIEISDNFPEINSKEKDLSQSEFEKMVNNAINKIKSFHFDKVVLARFSSRYISDNFSLKNLFISLCKTYINSFVYCLKANEQVWIGATPELLLKNNNFNLKTNAIAGTSKIGQNINFGEKEIEEQKFVKNYIAEILTKSNSENIRISQSNDLQNGNLKHIFNEIIFTNKYPLEILKKLHPTPAVCGLPYTETYNFIINTENFDRSFYSGFLGWIKNKDDFEFWVNLRCARIFKNNIKLYAGAGITSQSNSLLEWSETENKMKILGNLLIT